MWNLEVCNFEVNTALTGHRNNLTYLVQSVLVRLGHSWVTVWLTMDL